MKNALLEGHRLALGSPQSELNPRCWTKNSKLPTWEVEDRNSKTKAKKL